MMPCRTAARIYPSGYGGAVETLLCRFRSARAAGRAAHLIYCKVFATAHSTGSRVGVIQMVKTSVALAR
jgi:hypothetical protein